HFRWPLALPMLVVFTLGVLAALAISLLRTDPPAVTPAGRRMWQVATLGLQSGTARLDLPGIGDVVVDGPADFAMLDPMRARLTKGRIRVRVTEKTGHGFVVETPYGNVTDLGTEFGLEVSDPGSAGLVVFDGEV